MPQSDLFLAAINFVKTDLHTSPIIHQRDTDPTLVLLQVICKAYAYNGQMGFQLEIIFDYQIKNNAHPGQPDLIYHVLPLTNGGFAFIP